MARIRTVKPEFFKHYELFKAEKETKLPLRLAFEGLWLCSDKEGRFKYNPTHLKLDVLPYDELDFRIVLAALEAYGFILRYTVEGKKYGVIPTLKDHQRFSGTEAKSESKLPAPPQNLLIGISLEELREQYGSNMELPEKQYGNSDYCFENQKDETKELPENFEGSSEERRKGEKERNKERKGEKEEPPKDFSLDGVIWDIEKFLLGHPVHFEAVCMESRKTREQILPILKKFHLWNVQKESYPKKPLPLIAGLKTWILNEKNFVNGNGTYQQQPSKSNPKTSGVNRLLGNIKQTIDPGRTENG